jgi:PHD/YefM family antitoxin component YafN of YafNO toxin-antitoxin module
MKFVTMSTARSTLPTLIAELDRAVITRNGLPAAVLVGFDEFRAMRADLLLLRDRGQMAAVEDALEAVRASDVERFPEMVDELETDEAVVEQP